MTIELMKCWKKNILWLSLTAMLLSTSGCFSLRDPFGRRGGTKSTKGLVVEAQTNNQALQLGAMDIANILVGIGFTPEQVMTIGQDVQLALMQRGGVGIKQGGEAVVQMRVLDERIQIVSSRTGYFEYDVKTHQFTLGGAQQSLPMQQQEMMQQPVNPQMQMMQPGTMQPSPNNYNYPSFPTTTTQGSQYIY